VTYRHQSLVPPGFSTLSGRALFLYYHSSNNTWTIALEVGSLEVIAFGVGCSFGPDDPEGQWFVSEASEYRIRGEVHVRRASGGMADGQHILFN
jgi:hypothetical protein